MLKPVSLVLAITGHRDLYPEDCPGYEAEIGRIFAELRAKYPHTPLLLLSGLAEGADRLAARAAIHASIPYIAVLPTPDGDAEFTELAAKALRDIHLPPCETPERAFEQLGEFLVKYSQILIAVWDRKPTGKKGGTGEVVAMKLRHRASGRMGFSRANGKGAGPVYEIAARRQSDGPAEPVPALKRHIRYPAGSKPEDYEANYRLQDQFDADLARAAGASFEAAAAQSRERLFDGEEAIGLSEAMDWVAELYARADALAIRFARVNLRIWKTTFLLLALAGVALAWQQTRGDGLPVMAVYWICAGLATGLATWEVKSKRRNRHEDYRALAEALRVQFFWMAAGLRDLAAEQYLRKQAPETVWIRDAMSECGLFQCVAGAPTSPVEDIGLRLGLAMNWVEGQANWFLKTHAKIERRKKILTRCAIALAALSMMEQIAGFIPAIEGTPAGKWTHTIAAVLALWGALIWTYIERRGLAAEARQYARMYDLFSDAALDLKKCESEGSYAEAEHMLRELGREALAENGDWLAMHRERKLPVRPE